MNYYKKNGYRDVMLETMGQPILESANELWRYYKRYTNRIRENIARQNNISEEAQTNAQYIQYLKEMIADEEKQVAKYSKFKKNPLAQRKLATVQNELAQHKQMLQQAMAQGGQNAQATQPQQTAAQPQQATAPQTAQPQQTVQVAQAAPQMPKMQSTVAADADEFL